MDSHRVFISYSHEDKELVERIVKVIEENGLVPIWDQRFMWGHGFPDQIKKSVAHCHVFVPVITEASSKRGWVHQEIGYAMALNIPILPITLGEVPGEMLRDLLPVPWTDDMEGLKTRLSLETFKNLVSKAQRDSLPLFVCAELLEDRTKMMIEYAKGISALGCTGHVRQKGGLSSFSIPDNPVTDRIWNERYGRFQVSAFRCRLLRDERKELERHATESGFSIIINPRPVHKKYGPKATKVRIQTLLQFLESARELKRIIRVAVDHDPVAQGSLTIVGDWFMAQSITAVPGEGYRQTIFTSHAPTIQKCIEEFDTEIDALLQRKGLQAESSLEVAISELKTLLN